VTNRTCSHPDGCPEPHEARGWCHLHYKRVRKTGDPGPVGVTRIRGNDHARFESRVDRSGGPDACHPWTGPLDPCGYGRIGVGGTNRLVHDVAWEWASGQPIPSGHEVDHECHNQAVRAGTCRPGVCTHRRCCNERHLVTRTRQGHRDATEHYNGARGSANASAKLTEADIPLILAALAAGESQASIGLRYGVSQRAICRINRREGWTHVV
jgi:hypothetical protein